MSNRRRIKPNRSGSPTPDPQAVLAALVNYATLRETPKNVAVLNRIRSQPFNGLNPVQALRVAQVVAAIARAYGRQLPPEVRESINAEVESVFIEGEIDALDEQLGCIGGG